MQMIKLARFTQDDIPQLLSWLTDADAEFLIQFAGRNFKYPLTEQQLLLTMEEQNSILFKPVDPKSNIPIGHCQFLRIDKKEKSASIGRVFIRDAYRGKNYGFELIESMKFFGKERLGLKKLSLRVFDFNIPAINCYRKSGFKEVKKELQFYQTIQKEWCCITMEYIYD